MVKKSSRPKRNRRPIRKEIGPCYFCQGKIEPDYKDYEKLTKFMTDRAKIVGRKRNGLCAKHQRRVSVAVKRARHLGLLPFTAGL
ncbi:30S ribosomal protein S18 [Patescibacteria group bacterium]|nr:30S ribosomal protein S18 [Patescibacteria group bacterium]